MSSTKKGLYLFVTIVSKLPVNVPRTHLGILYRYYA